MQFLPEIGLGFVARHERRATIGVFAALSGEHVEKVNLVKRHQKVSRDGLFVEKKSVLRRPLQISFRWLFDLYVKSEGTAPLSHPLPIRSPGQPYTNGGSA